MSRWRWQWRGRWHRSLCGRAGRWMSRRRGLGGRGRKRCAYGRWGRCSPPAEGVSDGPRRDGLRRPGAPGRMDGRRRRLRRCRELLPGSGERRGVRCRARVVRAGRAWMGSVGRRARACVGVTRARVVGRCVRKGGVRRCRALAGGLLGAVPIGRCGRGGARGPGRVRQWARGHVSPGGPGRRAVPAAGGRRWCGVPRRCARGGTADRGGWPDGSPPRRFGWSRGCPQAAGGRGTLPGRTGWADGPARSPRGCRSGRVRPGAAPVLPARRNCGAGARPSCRSGSPVDLSRSQGERRDRSTAGHDRSLAPHDRARPEKRRRPTAPDVPPRTHRAHGGSRPGRQAEVPDDRAGARGIRRGNACAPGGRELQPEVAETPPGVPRRPGLSGPTVHPGRAGDAARRRRRTGAGHPCEHPGDQPRAATGRRTRPTAACCPAVQESPGSGDVQAAGVRPSEGESRSEAAPTAGGRRDGGALPCTSGCRCAAPRLSQAPPAGSLGSRARRLKECQRRRTRLAAASACTTGRAHSTQAPDRWAGARPARRSGRWVISRAVRRPGLSVWIDR